MRIITRNPEAVDVDLDPQVPPATVFVDVDWLRPGAARAIVCPDDGIPLWHDGTGAVHVLEQGPPATVARALLDALAAEVAELVRRHAPEGVACETVGLGAVAGLVRQAATPPAHGVAPEVIVDLTGRADVLLDATRRLATGGLLVLAGPPWATGLDIDLYADVHSRGLVVACAGPAPEQAGPPGVARARRLAAPIAVAPGAPVVPGAVWYQVRFDA